jgi:RNA polymerase sigma-70 factor (ECF subfamily)
VFGIAFRRVGDRSLAEDLAQETFLRAWRARRSLRHEAAVRGWLCAIATNVVRDHVRASARRREDPEPEFIDIPAPGADPAIRAEHGEALRSLADALRALPPRQREMFLLRERDGLTYREIARVLRCPIGTVMSGLARARERLLEALR